MAVSPAPAVPLAVLPDVVLELPAVLELPELQAASRVTAASAARAVVVAAREGPLRPVGSAPERLRYLMPNLLVALSGAAARVGAGREGVSGVPCARKIDPMS
jgi:hypothetical protein